MPILLDVMGIRYFQNQIKFTNKIQSYYIDCWHILIEDIKLPYCTVGLFRETMCTHNVSLNQCRYVSLTYIYSYIYTDQQVYVKPDSKIWKTLLFLKYFASFRFSESRTSPFKQQIKQILTF
uniref:Uncharacterized protein n=1 Tax=Cacopsylla melanoneura TaxID=428564 RepID=A0A8D8X9G2_9HEMI